MDNRRWPRVGQKGRECSVDGCERSMTGNDLCAAHTMALRRYGRLDGKEPVKMACETCGDEFLSKKGEAMYCSPRCYQVSPVGKKALRTGQDRWRQKNPVRASHVNSLSKKTVRHFAVVENCIREGCGTVGERHHPDYTRPYEIVWLCGEHHKGCHVAGTDKDFDVMEKRKCGAWEAVYTKQQEWTCWECGEALAGKELFIRGLGARKRIFCSEDCSKADFYRIL